MKRKIFSLLLCVVMLVSMLAVCVSCKCDKWNTE